MRRDLGSSVFVTFLGLVAGPVFATESPGSRPAQQRESPAPFFEKLPRDVARMLKQMRVDARRVTVRQANLFHRRFLDTCMQKMPRDLTFQNQGLIATDIGQQSLKIEGSIGEPLRWGIGREGLGLFSFWISTRRTKQTVAKCAIDGRKLFLNVDFVQGNRTVEEKLPELGGRSIRETLSEIEKPPPSPRGGKRQAGKRGQN